MTVTTCPRPEEIQSLLEGGRPEGELAALEEHVQQCASCLARLDQLFCVPDTLVGLLSQAGTESPTTGPVVADMVQKIKSLHAASASGFPTPLMSAEHPTPSPLGRPGGTGDFTAPDAVPDSSLTDFLAPPQAEGELGRLGDYRILQVLGHGGMGVVFLGEDLTLGRQVAIKAMLPHLALSKRSQQRFLREARAAAALEHDNIVAIHHVGEDRGLSYIVMPLLKGQSLDKRLHAVGKMSAAEVVRIGREIACALDVAHKAGLVHRDIKPGNIWLEAPQGRVKILDFGLARAASEESGPTQQGAIIGTPAYMAPEQGRGDSVDGRCDLFSLGVVLYRLCTGQQPFQGRDAVSTLMAVAMHEPPAPVQINADVPPKLSELVMKLLDKDIDSRIGSAAEVVTALQAMEKHVAFETMVQDRTSGGASPPGDQRLTLPRLPGKVLLLATVFGFLTILAGTLNYWQTNNGVISPDGQPVTRPLAEDSLENWTVSLVHKFQGHTDIVRDVALSGDGKLAVTASDDGTAILWDAVSGKKLTTFLGHTDPGAGPHPGNSVQAVSLSGDGKRVLTGSHDRTAILWDAASGKILQTFRGHASTVTSVAFTSDGKHVVTASADTTAALWDVESGEKIRTFDEGHSSFLYGVALSGDDKLAVTGGYDSTAVLWDVASGKILKSFRGGQGEIHGVALSRDGKLVVASVHDNTAILFDTVSGTQVQTYRGHSDYVWGVALSGDSKFLLTGSADRTAILWDTASGKKLHTFAGHTKTVTRVALSGDAKLVLTGSEDHTAILWQLQATSSQPAKTADGFISLFNGKDLTGWTTFPNTKAIGGWRVAGGNLTCVGLSSHLYSERNDFKNFHFRVEVKINDGGDSGQLFRCKFGKHPQPIGYEAQIGAVIHESVTGSLIYSPSGHQLASVKELLVPADTWFTQEVIARGNHIQILVNGKKVVDYTDDQNRPQQGRLALQHWGEQTRVEFRKVEIKELEYLVEKKSD